MVERITLLSSRSVKIFYFATVISFLSNCYYYHYLRRCRYEFNRAVYRSRYLQKYVSLAMENIHFGRSRRIRDYGPVGDNVVDFNRCDIIQTESLRICLKFVNYFCINVYSYELRKKFRSVFQFFAFFSFFFIFFHFTAIHPIFISSFIIAAFPTRLNFGTRIRLLFFESKKALGYLQNIL